jgi:hypothetical protein
VLKDVLQREYLDSVAERLQITDFEQWYHVTATDLDSRVLKLYGGSLAKALMNVYPEYNWILWKFVQVPHHTWDNKENVKQFVHWAANELGISSLQEWYTGDYCLITYFITQVNVQ